MRIIILFVSLFCWSYTCKGQTAKTDTIKGVVIYTAPSDLVHISKGDYHTYTVEAIQIKTDTGIIAIRTEFGFLDLDKNYQFIPKNKLQPKRLKSKP